MVRAATADIPSLGGSRQEFIAVLEKNRNNMFITVYKDIIFIEGTPKTKTDIKKVDIELLGNGTQLRNLRDVKEKLHHLVKEMVETVYVISNTVKNNDCLHFKMLLFMQMG